MSLDKMTIIMIPEQDWVKLVRIQKNILTEIKELKTIKDQEIPVRYVTALQYMKAVNIKRTKFDELVNQNKIKIIKKKRKIYVPFSEIDRYFTDISIQ